MRVECKAAFPLAFFVSMRVMADKPAIESIGFSMQACIESMPPAIKGMMTRGAIGWLHFRNIFHSPPGGAAKQYLSN
jgi:hypothetical protein